MKDKFYTLLVYSENVAGILNEVTNVFTRIQVNIESLNVSASSIDGVHKYTITCWSNPEQIVKIKKQLEKKLNVIKANYYTDDQLFIHEVALYKISTPVLLKSYMFVILHCSMEYSSLIYNTLQCSDLVLWQFFLTFVLSNYVELLQIFMVKKTLLCLFVAAVSTLTALSQQEEMSLRFDARADFNCQSDKNNTQSGFSGKNLNLILDVCQYFRLARRFGHGLS